MEITEILNQCTVNDNIIKLPAMQLDREDYLQVKKKLEFIGGKWKGGKTQGFVFPQDPTDIFEEIKNGKNRNLKKEFQFFETPAVLADELVRLSGLNIHHTVLEPSAGQGAIVKAIHRLYPLMPVACFELNELNCKILSKMENVHILANDFLNNAYTKFPESVSCDRIIANPPFSKNQDIEHIYLMYALLNEGGRMVSICSKHYLFCDNKKETQFREWLNTVNAKVTDIPEGAFKESGTSIATQIIEINKLS